MFVVFQHLQPLTVDLIEGKAQSYTPTVEPRGLLTQKLLHQAAQEDLTDTLKQFEAVLPHFMLVSLKKPQLMLSWSVKHEPQSVLGPLFIHWQDYWFFFSSGTPVEQRYTTK